MRTWILAGLTAALTLTAAVRSEARARPLGAPAAQHAPARARSAVAEITPHLALSSGTVRVTTSFGIGFINGLCDEQAPDFCSLAARIYHTLGPSPSPQIRIGTVAGTAAGGANGRLGFIMNVPGWRLLRARRRLTVAVHGTIVHGGTLVGRIDQWINLVIVR